MAELFIVGLIVVPIILCLILKANANFIFLSATLGYMMSNFLSKNETLRSVLINNLKLNNGASDNIQLVLILLPVVLTTLVMFGTVPKKAMIPNIASAAALGFLLCVLVIPLLPSSLNLLSSSIWNQVKNVQDIVIGAGSIFVLINLLMIRPKHAHSKSKKHHE